MKRGVIPAILLVLVAGGLRAQAKSEPVRIVRASHVWDGERDLGSAFVVIKDGKIADIMPLGTGWADLENWSPPPAYAGAEIIDAPEGWVIPGMVLAASSQLTAPRSSERAVDPAAVASDAFDPFQPLVPFLRTGIAAAYAAPGGDRLMPGFGSVVRLASADPLEAVLEPRAMMQAVLRFGAGKPPAIYDAPLAPGPDDPIGPARRQRGATLGGAVARLRELFELARTKDDLTPDSRDRIAVDLRPLRDVLERRVPLRVACDNVAEIRQAIALARRFELRLVISGGAEAWRLAEDLAAIDAGVILQAGEGPATPRSADRAFRSGRIQREPMTASRLRGAGVKVALVTPSGGEPHDLLWYAAQAVQDGFDQADALTAVTAHAADLLGVGDRLGRLAKGRAADLVVYHENPFAAGATPLAAMSQGRFTIAPAPVSKRVALRAKEVWRGVGDPIARGIILIEDGKITDVGADLALPPGTRLLRYDDSVIVPGFVDGGGQIGIRSYRDAGEGEIDPGGALANLPLTEFAAVHFDPIVPDVAGAAAAGVTTVALTPSGGRPVSGILSVVKTDGDDKDDVLVERAGLLLDYSRTTWTPSIASGLKRQLTSGRKYSKAWVTYEEKLAEYEAKKELEAKKKGKAEKAATEDKMPPVMRPTPRDPITGEWIGSIAGDGIPSPWIGVIVDLERKGQEVSGSVTAEIAPDPLPITGRYRAGRLQARIEIAGARYRLRARVLRDEIRGTWRTEEGARGTFTLRRQARTTWSADGKKPSKPAKKKDAEKGDKKKAEAAKKGDAKSDGKKPAATKKDDKKSDDKKKSDKKKTDKKKDAKGGPPKAPKKVAASEIYRALFESERPVFVAARGKTATREVLEILRDEFELTTILISSDAMPDVIEDVSRLGAAFSPTGAAVVRKKGRIINPASVAFRKKVPVMYRSGWNGDPRQLYAIAAHAVAHGMSADRALGAITRWPARIFGIADKVGSIDAGRHADLVILDGRPFAPETRIRAVMIQGRFVGEETP